MKAIYKNVCILLTFVTIVKADFNDFVIRNKNDLKRFDFEDEDDYNEDDNEYFTEYFNDMPPDVDGCGGAYEYSNSILRNDGPDDAENALDKLIKNGNMNAEIMRQIIKQLQKDSQYSQYSGHMQQAHGDSRMYSDVDDGQARNDMDIFCSLDESDIFYVE